MADFVKSKAAENPKFLKSAGADAEKPLTPECKKLRGLDKGKPNCSAKKLIEKPLSFLESLKSQFQLLLKRPKSP